MVCAKLRFLHRGVGFTLEPVRHHATMQQGLQDIRRHWLPSHLKSYSRKVQFRRNGFTRGSYPRQRCENGVVGTNTVERISSLMNQSGVRNTTCLFKFCLIMSPACALDRELVASQGSYQHKMRWKVGIITQFTSPSYDLLPPVPCLSFLCKLWRDTRYFYSHDFVWAWIPLPLHDSLQNAIPRQS